MVEETGSLNRVRLDYCRTTWSIFAYKEQNGDDWKAAGYSRNG